MRESTWGTMVARWACMRSWLLVALVSGCTIPDFTTNGTSIHATGQDDGHTLVTICAGPSGLLDCNDKETFVVTLGADSQVPMEGFLSFGALSTDFPTNSTDSVVIVTQDSDNGRAVTSLPPPFDLHGPAQDVVIPHSASVTLTWTPAAGVIELSSSVTCASTSDFGDTRTIEDNGQITVDLGDLPKPGDGICQAGLTLTRTRHGKLDTVYPPSSTIVGEQERSVGFMMGD